MLEAIGTSCEWIAGEPVPSCLMHFTEPAFPSSYSGSYIFGACAPTCWPFCVSVGLCSQIVILGGSEFQVGQKSWLSSPHLHLFGICAWAPLSGPVREFHMARLLEISHWAL